MNKTNIKIKSIEINNFKNVKYGVIDLKNTNSPYNSSVLGIYGQNGSGKTALIDSVYLLKLGLSGKKIPAGYGDYINVDSDFAMIKYTIEISDYDSQYLYTIIYQMCIRKEIDESTQNIDNFSLADTKYKTVLFDEVLSCSYEDKNTKMRMSSVIDTKSNDIFEPKTKYELLVGKDKDVKAELMTAKKLTSATSRSFIFSNELLKIIKDNCKEKLYCNLFEKLVQYGNFGLFVIDTSNSGLITLNTLPLTFKYHEKNKTAAGSFPLMLNEPSLIPEEALFVVEKVINKMNIVLKQLIPGLTINIKKLGTELFANGITGVKVQLVSQKNSKEIPLKYESEGIKKIISILQLLIVMYNESAVTVAIDELDSGVFEYLLGELLRIISEKGKGQLIFTSHNLRPLETLNREFIAFTTTNPEKRYIRLTNVKSNNNLRDFYYRDIILGEQSEILYDDTNNYEIAFAFREAGE